MGLLEYYILVNLYIQQNINQDIIELSPISYEAISANRSDYIIVMINFKSHLLFDGEKCTLNEIDEKISYSFHRKVSDVYPQLNRSPVDERLKASKHG